MKDDNRREVLSKLGLGAAAIAAAATAAATAGIAQAQVPPRRELAGAVRAAATPDRVLRVQRTGAGAGTQIKVAYGDEGIRVTELRQVEQFTRVGWDQRAKELNLAVAVNGDRVSIEGLGNIVATADGRCNLSLRNAGEAVINPDPTITVRGEAIRR